MFLLPHSFCYLSSHLPLVESSFTMAEMVGGAVLGVVLPGTYKAGVCMYKVFSGSDRKKLEQTVNSLLPTIKEICDSSSGSSVKSSLQKFQEFHDKLAEGNRLVDEHYRSRNFLWKFWVAKRVKKLQKNINEFIRIDLPSVMAVIQIKSQNSVSTQLETLCEEVKILTSKIEQHTNFLEKKIEIQQQDESLCGPPDTPRCLLGFDEHIMKLTKFVLEDGVKVVGITAMGGAGKSTLATAVCHHNEIKGRFEKSRIVYIHVSESPDLSGILKTMWKSIVGLGRPEPDFNTVEDAHNKLQSQISLIKKPTLVVLDDIWSKSDLLKLLFEGEQYKTLVTTRDKNVIPKGPNSKTRVYELPLLQQEHALSLFCHCAFGEPTIPKDQDKELVEQVQAECRGLPLALQVIGSSTYGRSDWERAKNMLSEGEPFDDYHKEGLLNRLKTSIDVLDDDEKQCFLDLVGFPQRKAIPANALLDIWVYVRGINQDKAVVLLLKFAARHLLDLKRNAWTHRIRDDCMNSYTFSQHDVMRDLALFLAEQDNKIHFRRMYMPQRQSDFPPKWQTHRYHSSKAQIVSIHTGAMSDTQWPQMDFPEVEALILYFNASEYCIPPFLVTMKKLKVLQIHNDSAKRAKLGGLADFQALSQLKTLHLERLMVPSLHEHCKVLESLEKLYLSLCEGLGRDKMFNFPGLLEFNVDHCSDLEELPAGICSSNSLKMLSITNCHCLAKLPDELGKLGSLKEIRLCESPALKALPPSICSLTKLQLLDISSCMQLKVRRRGYSVLKETLQTLAKLPSLKCVICDEDNKEPFESSSRPGLKVELVEQCFNLDWLDSEGTKLQF